MNEQNPYAVQSQPDYGVAALAERAERVAFIQRTYLHLGLAVICFVVLEGILLTLYPPAAFLQQFGPLMGRWGWLVVLGAFMVVSWVARGWAESSTSRGLQYAGLMLYVVAEALIFMPLMAYATLVDPSIPMNAGLITAVVFGGLTAFVFLTGSDFSGLGKYLWIGGLVALGIIVASIVVPGGLGLGMWFSAALVLLAAGYILYDTSNVLHHYRTDQHVAASLALFASVALMLWYVMQILISLQRD
ncbi:MAG: permease [Planctomycetota bacterium]|nr:MAG: permease [Planctomycetota bacterium]